MRERLIKKYKSQHVDERKKHAPFDKTERHFDVMLYHTILLFYNDDRAFFVAKLIYG